MKEPISFVKLMKIAPDGEFAVEELTTGTIAQLKQLTRLCGCERAFDLGQCGCKPDLHARKFLMFMDMRAPSRGDPVNPFVNWMIREDTLAAIKEKHGGLRGNVVLWIQGTCKDKKHMQALDSEINRFIVDMKSRKLIIDLLQELPRV